MQHLMIYVNGGRMRMHSLTNGPSRKVTSNLTYWLVHRKHLIRWRRISRKSIVWRRGSKSMQFMSKGKNMRQRLVAFITIISVHLFHFSTNTSKEKRTGRSMKTLWLLTRSLLFPTGKTCSPKMGRYAGRSAYQKQTSTWHGLIRCFQIIWRWSKRRKWTRKTIF